MAGGGLPETIVLAETLSSISQAWLRLKLPVLVSDYAMWLRLVLHRVQLNRLSRLLKIACLLLIVCIMRGSSSQGFAGVPALKRKSCKHHGIARGASRWWTALNTSDCLANRIQVAYETKMKTRDVPVLQSWDAYEASLPVRQGNDEVIELQSLPFLCI